MTPQPPDPHQDLLAVREATARLLDEAGKLDPSAVAEPSRLAGWTRGHVLTHLARNADSLVNLLTWARTGEETPQYASGDQRDADVAAGSTRPLEEQLADLRESSERFEQAAQSLPPAAWAAQVMMRSGRVVAAAELPWARLVELQVHHMDLGAGYTSEDFPAEFTERFLAFGAEAARGHEGVAAVRVRETGSGAEWEIGAAEPELTVSGPAHALAAWLAGRGGDGLRVDPPGPLPAVPGLG